MLTARIVFTREDAHRCLGTAHGLERFAELLALARLLDLGLRTNEVGLRFVECAGELVVVVRARRTLGCLIAAAARDEQRTEGKPSLHPISSTRSALCS